MSEGTWPWGTLAPDRWFADRGKGSVLVRGYLSVRAQTPERPTPSDALWSYDIGGADLMVAVRSGTFDVPCPLSVRYVGNDRLVVEGHNQTAHVPEGVYTILVTPLAGLVNEIDDRAERAAVGRLDAAAGLVGVTVSPNAVYQHAFEFFADAKGASVHVIGPTLRNGGRSPEATLTKDGLTALKRAFDAQAGVRETIRRRVHVSLRWYAQALSERNRVDSFLKFWIAIEALALNGKASTVPLEEALASAYQRDRAWVRATLAVDRLALLRAGIVHSGRQPMLHGNVLELAAALYEDVLHAKLGLPGERRAESKLPEGKPFDLARWQDSGSIATAVLRTPKEAGLRP